VLELARSGADLRGVVSFHGGLDAPMPAQKGAVKAKILVLTGEDDPMVTKEQVQAFQREMADANVPVSITTYPHAVHAFTNPDADKAHIPGVAYNKEADEQSWKAMQDFFSKIFGP
jgi:dienelactone hydrolase